MNTTEKLFDFIAASPSAYHTVETLKKRLTADGYAELSETDAWKLAPGGKYFTVRNGTSLIAFRLPAKKATGFAIVAAHTDQPSFRVKRVAETANAYTRLEVEKYGGMIYYTWLDRPLSVAGRLLVRDGEGISSKLVNIDRDLLVIPSVAIHMNRTVNDGYKFNPAVDLLPLLGAADKKGALLPLLAEAAGVKEEDVLSHDLFLYVREQGRTFGAEGEYILCPRLDDLGCVFAAAEGFFAAAEAETVPVLAVFDNEEVGSETKQGAASTFLADTLARIGGERTREMIAGSFMVSADNAHAKHPNHPEYADPDHAPLLNGGLVVKYNANQRYATDGVSDALFRLICEKAGAKTQTYYNRADLPGGSTLGSISDTRVSVPTVDIGLPQLAMHAANETAGAKDADEMIKALTAFYAANIKKTATGYTV